MLRKLKKLLAVVISIAILATMLSGLTVFAAGTTRTVGTEETGATYRTIADALAAANDGDTIYLFNGTYPLGHTEVVNNLTITGQSKNGVVLNPTDDTADPYTYDLDDAGWVAILTGASLSLSNLTMDGTGKLISHALWTTGALTVNNVTIKHIRYDDFVGTGIGAFQPGSLIATNVTMSNIERIGIDDQTAATINGFNYTGKGAGDFMDYALQIRSSIASASVPFTANVTNAIIKDCLGTNGSTGIKIDTVAYSYYFEGHTNLITANINSVNISNCTIGVCSGFDPYYEEWSNTTTNHSNFINCDTDLAYYGSEGTGIFTTGGNYYGGGAPTVDDVSGTITGLDNWLSSIIPVAFSVSNSIGKTGSYVTVKVSISQIFNDIGTGTIVLPYDSTKLEFVSAVAGEALIDAEFCDINHSGSDTSLVYLSMNGISNAGSILEVTYKILATGDVVIPVVPTVLELFDIQYNNLNYTIVNGEIIVDNTPPAVTGVTDGASYNENKTIDFTDLNGCTATLNDEPFTSGTTVTAANTYSLVVTDVVGNVTTVHFIIDRTNPVVTGVADGGLYKEDKVVSFDEGTATLNGDPFVSGTTVSEGTWTLVVTDAADNVTTVNFRIDETFPEVT
ncbi:MAG: hypothetical protein WCN92_12435, partial [Eubacteriales bacterium]